MERFLLVSGRVISALFAALGVALLVILLSGVIMVNAVAVVPAFGQNLVNDHVLDDLRPALWQSFLEAIPAEVAVGSVSIPTAPLVNAFQLSLRDIIDQGLPLGQWLETRARQLVDQTVADLRGQVTTRVEGGVRQLQDALSGTAAEQLANVLLATLQQCTDVQVAEISRVLGAGPSPTLSVAISFLCRPPDSVGIEARDLMRNALTVALAEVAAQAGARLEERLATFDLSDITIDTPLGPARLDWPTIRVGGALLGFSIPIPEGIVQAVEAAAAAVTARAEEAGAQVSGQVQEARATLEGLGAALATEVTTRTPPTATITPVPATATPTPTPEPTPTPAEVEAERAAVSPLEQRVLDLLNGIAAALAATQGQLTNLLVLILGLPLLAHTWLQLYLVRALRPWGLWIGAVLAASGVILLLINGRLTANLTSSLTPTGEAALPDPLLEVGGRAMLALQSALTAHLNGPFQTWGLLLLAAGVLALAALGVSVWRDRKAAAI